MVTGGPIKFTGHVYNTIGLNDCPDTLWTALDTDQLKKELKAKAVILNGPRYLLMDANALTGPGKLATFQGLEMRHLADLSLPLASVLRGKSKPYEENTVARTTQYTFTKGRPVYELVSPKGTVYVMQSYARTIKPKLTAADLPRLGEELKLPEGWNYRERIPSEDLVIRTSGTAHVIQDELENTYQRVE